MYLEYAYTIGTLVWVFLWIALYFFLKSSQIRKEMLTMSFAIAPLGISEIIYVKDYWHPDVIWQLPFGIDIESIVLSFAIGGIASVSHEAFFSKIYTKKYSEHEMFPFIIAFTALIFMILGTYYFEINSIYTSTLAMIVAGIAIIMMRSDLTRVAFFNALIVGMLAFLLYTLVYLQIFPGAVQAHWKLDNLSGIFFFNLPIEEILWWFALGFAIGPSYEFIKGLATK